MVVAGIPEFLETNPEYPIAAVIGMKTGKTKMNAIQEIVEVPAHVCRGVEWRPMEDKDQSAVAPF